MLANDADVFSYKPAGGNLDPFVGVIAAAGQAQSVMDRLKDGVGAFPPRPSETKLGRFFKNEYKVGTEALLKDMPLLVLLEILSVSLLVLRSCILGVFGTNAEKVKRNPLYLFGVDWPLRLYNTLVLFFRRAPGSWIGIQVGLFIASVLALLIGITWRDSIIYNNQKEILLKWFVVFIAAPLIIIGAQCVFMWRGKVGTGKRIV